MTSLAPNTMWMADWVKCSVLLASVRVNVGTFGAYLFSVSYALLLVQYILIVWKNVRHTIIVSIVGGVSIQ